jgi:hypothetical protein
MASNMPVTRSEFKDSCRSNFSSMMLKYQDDIIMLVKNKVEAAVTKKKEKKKREHIVFEDGVQAATNPEAKELIKKSVQYSNKIEDKPNLVLIEG